MGCGTPHHRPGKNPWFRHTSSCRYHAILDYKCSLKLEVSNIYHNSDHQAIFLQYSPQQSLSGHILTIFTTAAIIRPYSYNIHQTVGNSHDSTLLAHMTFTTAWRQTAAGMRREYWEGINKKQFVTEVTSS